MTRPARCYHCELDLDRRRWLDEDDPCARCRAAASLQGGKPAYTLARAMVVLRALLDLQESGGLHLGRRWRQVLEAADIEAALRTAYEREILSAAELNCIVCRWVQHLSVSRTISVLSAAAGHAVSERSVRRWTAGAKIRLWLWLGGMRREVRGLGTARRIIKPSLDAPAALADHRR